MELFGQLKSPIPLSFPEFNSSFPPPTNLTFLFSVWKNNIHIPVCQGLDENWFRYFISDTMFIEPLMISNRYKYVVCIYWRDGWCNRAPSNLECVPKLLFSWGTATTPANYEFRTCGEEFPFNKMNNASITEWLSWIMSSGWSKKNHLHISCVASKNELISTVGKTPLMNGRLSNLFLLSRIFNTPLF